MRATPAFASIAREIVLGIGKTAKGPKHSLCPLLSQPYLSSPIPFAIMRHLSVFDESSEVLDFVKWDVANLLAVVCCGRICKGYSYSM